MKQTFVAKSEDIKINASNFIMDLPIDEPHKIVVSPYHKDRTLSQNALYWVWLTYIEKRGDTTKDELHYEFRRDHLVPIFERDDEEYAAMLQAVRDVYKSGMKVEAKLLERKIVEMTSTTQADVKQFTEYLNAIENHTREYRRIILPHPEDQYYEAMGIKR